MNTVQASGFEAEYTEEMQTVGYDFGMSRRSFMQVLGGGAAHQRGRAGHCPAPAGRQGRRRRGWCLSNSRPGGGTWM